MGTDLDFEVAKAAMSVRLLERALHDDGRWEFLWAGQRVPVERVRTDDGVVLHGTFEALVCFLVEPDPMVHLLVEGEVVAVHHLEVHPGEGGFDLDWMLTLEPVRAGA